MSSDRDNPSVPVTTLAGLTSISDLLSELPLSDTQSICASLNKSLLFHPRVAEEAQNLLSVHDDERIELLANAIAQTNTDQIVLKDKFQNAASNRPSQSNVPVPELLQGILDYNPTVFDTRSHVHHPQQSQQQPPQQSLQPQQQQNYQNPQSQQSYSQQINQNASQQSLHYSNDNQAATANHFTNYPQSMGIGGYANQTPQNLFPDPFNSNQFLSNSSDATGNGPGGSSWPAQQQQTLANAYGVSQQMQLDPCVDDFQQQQQLVAKYYEVGGSGDVFQGQGASGMQPRNNAFLEQQQLNKNQSPAQANDEMSRKGLRSDGNKINSVNNQMDQEIKMEDVSIKAEPPVDGESGKTQAELDNELFSKMKATERKRKPPPVVKKEEEEGEPFSQPKLRRVERKLMVCIPKLSKEDLLSSNTYQQFMTIMERIFEQLDETDTNVPVDEHDDDAECIPSSLLHSISSEAAKLKAKGTMDLVPSNKLSLLITYAMRSVNVAKNFGAGPDMAEEVLASDCVEKLVNAMEASLLVCNIYSCCNVKFLQEDNLDTIIKFLQFQLRETVFPSFDPVYTVVETSKKKKGDENSSSSKKKGKGGGGGHMRGINTIYTKVVDLTKVLVTIIQKFQFVDTIVIHASSIGVEPFFVDNIDTLQFVCLDLVTTIFQNEKYAKHRSNILADILSSLDRLHSSKKHLRPYKLANNGGSIQMVTALVLQLIQCSVVLPDTMYEMAVQTRKPAMVALQPSSGGGRGKKGNKNSSSSNNNSSNNLQTEEAADGGASTTRAVAVEKDLYISEKCETSISIGANFLQVFLSKCKPRSGETDFRPLFENFIHDLLTTVNKPEWPASELLLTLLGTLLVKNMSDKSVEQSIRVVSLEYLGIVAARLRKDAVESRCKVSTMDQLIKYIRIEQEKEGDAEANDSIAVLNPDEERVEFLQKILLDFLAVNAQEENIVWEHARHFYLTQWYRDILKKKRAIAEGKAGAGGAGSGGAGGKSSYAQRKKNKKGGKERKKKKKYKSSSDEEEGGDSDTEEEENSDEEEMAENSDEDGLADYEKDLLRKSGKAAAAGAVDQELNLEIFRMLERRKRFLLSNIRLIAIGGMNVDVRTYIDYNNAQLIAQYLSSKRSFSQSFDTYLNKIILVMWESSIAIRTKAMKCLTNVVEVDPAILKRKDMQIGVREKFLDASISVREAAVDLIGKYVLTSPELINQYYHMLAERILDTGVSVRKRVIKILRDICIEYPDFERIPEICVRMIRRVNDEESIQKLVTEVFLEMWFNPVENDNKVMISRKINQITDVVSCSNENTQWLDGLLKSIFKPKENKEDSTKIAKDPPRMIVWSCEQIVNGLVDAIVRLEEGSESKKLLGCITTLHLFAKIRPQLIVRHAITLEPYLNVKCNSTFIVRFMSCVAEILENVVPLMEHPSESFLYDLEKHLMMLVLVQHMTVVQSCIACLGAIVNKLTKNYKLIRDCFNKFNMTLVQCREKLVQDPGYPLEQIYTSLFRRSMFTVGLLTRYFDFTKPAVYGQGQADGLSPKICDAIFDCLMFFVTCSSLDIRKSTLQALGHFCVKNYEYLTQPQLRDFYRDLLVSEFVQTDVKVCVLKNILIYLNEEDQRITENETHWSQQAKAEDLKEMGDKQAGMASRVIQLYLKEVMNCFMHKEFSVRLWAMKVVEVVLAQGLVHPVQIVPYLISLSTDPETVVSHSADKHLQDIEKQYPGFINMKTMAGIQLSFELQMSLQITDENPLVRGYKVKNPDEPPTALTGFLYSLLRNGKPTRRALATQLIKQFDDSSPNLRSLLYLADSLAYFPYAVQDEPLYIMYQIDVLVTHTGTSLMVNFKEGLKPNPNAPPQQQQQQIYQQQQLLMNSNGTVIDGGNGAMNTLQLHAALDDEDDDDKDALFDRLPEDTTELQNCVRSAQGCMLLLLLKEHLKEMYGITDCKITGYSPSEANKAYDKSMQRKPVSLFEPKATIELIRSGEEVQPLLDEKGKRLLIDRYFEFKQLMLKLDPEDSDAEMDEDRVDKTNQGTPMKQQQQPVMPQIDFESTIDNLGGAVIPMNNAMSQNIPANLSNVSAFVVQNQNQYNNHHSTTNTTPVKVGRGSGGGGSRGTPKKQTTTKKGAAAATGKKKKRRVSSSEEESDYNSDSDY